jgi:hypothetical protein
MRAVKNEENARVHIQLVGSALVPMSLEYLLLRGSIQPSLMDLMQK